MTRLKPVPERAILTDDEAKRLRLCETHISSNFTQFELAGKALLRIRDEKLYRADFDTFQEYCLERWQMGRSHAYRLIEAAEIVIEVPEVQNERQARELKQFEKQLQKQVFEIASATAPGGEVTAEHIRGVGEVLTGIIQDGGIDDGSGEIKPLATILRANITEVVFERMKRQETAIQEKREKKTKLALENGKQKDIPARPVTHALFWLLKSLIHGIEYQNKDRNMKMHSALHAAYHVGKALIGESPEMRISVDDTQTEGECDRCPSRLLPVKDVTITTSMGGLSSSSMKLCGPCLDQYTDLLIAADAEVI